MMPDYEFQFERRRYGRTTYTWAKVKHPHTGKWLSLGDPWPQVRPKRAELISAAEMRIAVEGDNKS